MPASALPLSSVCSVPDAIHLEARLCRAGAIETVREGGEWEGFSQPSALHGNSDCRTRHDLREKWLPKAVVFWGSAGMLGEGGWPRTNSTLGIGLDLSRSFNTTAHGIRVHFCKIADRVHINTSPISKDRLVKAPKGVSCLK